MRTLTPTLVISIFLIVPACSDSSGSDTAGVHEEPLDASPGADATSAVDRLPPSVDVSASDAPRDVARSPDASVDVPASDVMQLPPLGAGVGTLAGSSESGRADGDRAHGRFNNPVNVTLGPDGNLYVADYDNGLLRVVRPDGQVSTLTRQSNFSRPFGLVFTPDGTLYAETDANDLGEVSRETGTLWRISLVDGAATVVHRNLGRPRGLAALPDGAVFMADPQHHVVAIIDPRTGVVSDLAGERDRAGFADGDGNAARFNVPFDTVVSGDVVLVADQLNHRIRAVTRGGHVSTWAGTGTAASTDGASATASFNRPQGLARDDAGNVYVTDLDSFLVRRVSPDGQVSTIAGNGREGYLDGAPREAEFHGLEGIDVSLDGALIFIADGNRGTDLASHRIRRIAFGAM